MINLTTLKKLIFKRHLRGRHAHRMGKDVCNTDSNKMFRTLKKKENPPMNNLKRKKTAPNEKQVNTQTGASPNRKSKWL